MNEPPADQRSPKLEEKVSKASSQERAASTPEPSAPPMPITFGPSNQDAYTVLSLSRENISDARINTRIQTLRNQLDSTYIRSNIEDDVLMGSIISFLTQQACQYNPDYQAELQTRMEWLKSHQALGDDQEAQRTSFEKEFQRRQHWASTWLPAMEKAFDAIKNGQARSAYDQASSYSDGNASTAPSPVPKPSHGDDNASPLPSHVPKPDTKKHLKQFPAPFRVTGYTALKRSVGRDNFFTELSGIKDDFAQDSPLFQINSHYQAIFTGDEQSKIECQGRMNRIRTNMMDALREVERRMDESRDLTDVIRIARIRLKKPQKNLLMPYQTAHEWIADCAKQRLKQLKNEGNHAAYHQMQENLKLAQAEDKKNQARLKERYQQMAAYFSSQHGVEDVIKRAVSNHPELPELVSNKEFTLGGLTIKRHDEAMSPEVMQARGITEPRQHTIFEIELPHQNHIDFEHKRAAAEDSMLALAAYLKEQGSHDVTVRSNNPKVLAMGYRAARLAGFRDDEIHLQDYGTEVAHSKKHRKRTFQHPPKELSNRERDNIVKAAHAQEWKAISALEHRLKESSSRSEQQLGPSLETLDEMKALNEVEEAEHASSMMRGPGQK